MKRSLFGAVALAAVALAVVLVSAASAAKPPPPAPAGNCPSSGTKNLLAASNVAASSTVSGQDITYSFTATSNGNQSTGLPGLVGLCAYTDGTATAATAHETDWTAGFNGGNVSFARQGGNKSNIVYSTSSQDVGTATFSTLPSLKNDIVLHIADSTTCKNVYGVDEPTCYVLPKPGPICNAASSADSNAAYNDIPKDVVHCGPPSRGFQATSTSEFGDVVGLSTAHGTHLSTMRVDFQSYACIDGGFWLNGTCNQDPSGATFPIPDTSGFQDSGGITARIYAAGPPDLQGNVTLGALIATARSTQEIPYRPAADPVKCTNPGTDSNLGDDTGKWYDAPSNTCRYSLSVPITFTGFTAPGGGAIPAFTDGQPVIWTVAFNTSTHGYNPIGTVGPYDALNVGTMTYYTGGIPFAGTQVDPASAFVRADNSAFYCHSETPPDVLRIDTIHGLGVCTSPQYLAPQADPDQTNAWTGYKPLGEIVLGP